MAHSSVASTVSSTILLKARSSRRGFVIENSDANRLYVLMDAATADTTTGYSFSLAQNDISSVLTYDGDVYGIWAADGTGAAMITEW